MPKRRATTQAYPHPVADAGFTLIEMMITVAILGILATVAIPAYQKYTQRARRVEGMEHVSKMIAGAVTYYQGHGVAPVAPALDKEIMGPGGYPHANGYRAGWAYGPALTQSAAFDLICGGDLGPLASGVFQFFRSPVYAKQLFVWDRLLFEPEGNKVRYYLQFWAESSPNFLNGYAIASRPRDCGNYAKGTVHIRTELKREGGVIRRVGPMISETI